MPAERIKSRRFPGVYFHDSKVRVHRGKPDRCFHVTFKQGGKTIRQAIGWASEGVTESYAHQKRLEFLTGNEIIKRRVAGATFGQAWEEYRAQAEADGLHIVPEESRYRKHIQPTFGHVLLDDLSEERLSRFRTELSATMAPGTVKHVLALMRRIINHALRRKIWSGQNPLASEQSGFRWPRVDNQGERFLTPEEAKLLLSALEPRSCQLADMSRLALSCGLRATEIFRLRGQDVDAAAMCLWVEAKDCRGRSQRQKVMLQPKLLEMLAGYTLAPGELLFRSRRGGPIRCISDTFTRVIGELGLNDGVTDPRRKVWFHTWRHTFISWLAQSGKVDLHELMILARHSRIESTLRYAHLVPDHVQSKSAIVCDKLAAIMSD